MNLRLLIRIHFFTWCLSTHVFAAIHYVDLTCTNPVSPYTSWVTAATNIQDAVNHALNGDTVLVTNGVYRFGGGGGFGLNRVSIDTRITLQSVNGPAVTIIEGYQVPGTTNGSNAVRCVLALQPGTLSGFTLTNGATQGSAGGGVLCGDTNFIVTNCVIAGNSSNDVGGGAAGVTLVNCIISGNSVPSGLNGTGGGAAGCLLVNCVLVNNFAVYGGAAASGGTLVNCTVVSNASVNVYGSLFSSRLKNSIVYDNFAHQTNRETAVASFFTNCCTSFVIPPSYGANNITNPPQFANAAAGDFRLGPDSPCIKAGNNSFIANATDLDGYPRIAGGAVDIGAYEFQSPKSIISYAWLQQYGLPTDGSADFLDTDGDSMTNWQEWRAGTDPLDPTSALRMISPPLFGTTASWQSVAGVHYFVQRSSNLSAKPAFSTVTNNIVGQAGTTSFIDGTATNGGPYYYRVGVQ